MQRTHKNIWTHNSEGGWIVITTNIGWKIDGSNPMGAGIARAAAERFPELPLWYGKKCRRHGQETGVLPYHPAKFFLFPTKPLSDQPWLSWKYDASLQLIMRSVRQLAAWIRFFESQNSAPIKPVGVPLVGCNNGNLRQRDVLPILEKHLSGDKFLLFSR